jgi:osmotically-inducible protein OsmY
MLAATPPRLAGRRMKPIITDKVLRAAVVKELESDPEVGAKHISVTSNDGAITLGGHVTRDHEKHAAVQAASVSTR